MRILGIDPGSRVTGYGVIDYEAGRLRHVAHGCLRLDGRDFNLRLAGIFSGLNTVIDDFAPQEIAIERVFVHRNVDSALRLGHARGAAICAVVAHRLPISEYTPREVKQGIAGYGAAEKGQVAQMVARLLALAAEPESDAADALAIAVHHAHGQGLRGRLRAHGAG
ncbi:MAG: crossover junction endodeoxyribonuclease RuvC [Chromatiales bacterium]|nr:crossover junction endodeoxyribonuclease RuvC [Chromatiales bacterium]